MKRRSLLTGVAQTVGGTAVAASVLGLLDSNAAVARQIVLRPPGALIAGAFESACARCGQCVSACPYGTLKLATPFGSIPAGTPYFEPRDTPCEMCEDIPCRDACPSGALSAGLASIDDARMGVAVLVDHENCLNFQGLRCDVCYRVCPLLDDAITLEMQLNPRAPSHAMFLPTVHAERCTGCGKCEKSCVLEEAAIRVLPRDLATGKLGAHYRWSWKEKELKGGSLLEREITDLPDRVPEAARP